MLLGVRLLSNADGNSPSLPGDWGDGDRKSLLDRFFLLCSWLALRELDKSRHVVQPSICMDAVLDADLQGGLILINFLGDSRNNVPVHGASTPARSLYSGRIPTRPVIIAQIIERQWCPREMLPWFVVSLGLGPLMLSCSILETSGGRLPRSFRLIPGLWCEGDPTAAGMGRSDGVLVGICSVEPGIKITGSV